MVSRSQQFFAVLQKNLILQTRSRRRVCGFEGWGGLALQILLPVLFFITMCIPKYYFKPQPYPSVILSALPELESRWSPGEFPYDGPARATGAASVIISPDAPAVNMLLLVLAKSLACPSDFTKKLCFSRNPSNFHCFFKTNMTNDDLCKERASCMAHPECYMPVISDHFIIAANEEAAVAMVSSSPDTYDAILAFESADLRQYALRFNHTSVPPTRFRVDLFASHPYAPFDKGLTLYNDYWFMTNLQLHVDSSIVGITAAQAAAPQAVMELITGTDEYKVVAATDVAPADIRVNIRPFAWPEKTVDVGSILVGLCFIILLVFAFMIPARGAVAMVVREKELRLREGMRMLGLSETAYWASWATSQWMVLALSGFLCTIVCMYPFEHSSFLLLLCFFWLFCASLLSFSFFLATFFQRARIAGTVAQLVYTACVLPGVVVPHMQPYGGYLWYLCCLLPQSAASLFALAMIQWEGPAIGLTWHTFSLPITQEGMPFSAAGIFFMLCLDLVLYITLTLYLDRVLPQTHGQQLHWLFPFSREFWYSTKEEQPPFPTDPVRERLLARMSPEAAAAQLGFAYSVDSAPQPVISVRNLTKTFQNASGGTTVALKGITLDVPSWVVTGLLGANGAGKTTLVSILTGMMSPTSGKACIFGLDVSTSMSHIRKDLGVCPQFDILWPDMTVMEHLFLYAVIKGFSRKDAVEEARIAAGEVGLEEKLHANAGELSGGQCRKLSVAIAFLGNPTLVFLDEPTSGMDPYTRRFSWDIIGRRRGQSSIVLTTHSMEEADILCQHVIVMAEGKVAAQGSPLALKAKYGDGYTLSVVLGHRDAGSMPQSPGSSAGALTAPDLTGLVAQIEAHSPGSRLLGCKGQEASFRLHRSEAASFPALLRWLDSQGPGLGVVGYGLTMTTLEEVFLRIAESSRADGGVRMSNGRSNHTAQPPAITSSSSDPEQGGRSGTLLGRVASSWRKQQPAQYTALPTSANGATVDASVRLTGWRLRAVQLASLVRKRALSARRDRLTMMTQIAVPMMLVSLSLWFSSVPERLSDFQPLSLTRRDCMLGAPGVFSASPAVRSSPDFEKLLSLYPKEELVDSNHTAIFGSGTPFKSSVDGWLFAGWGNTAAKFDALHLPRMPSVPNISQGFAEYVVLFNQSALAAIPAAISQANSMLLAYVEASMGRNTSSAPLQASSHPMPVLPTEIVAHMEKNTVLLMVVLCFTLAGCVLSASFVIFPVRERETNSKHVQLVCGAPPLLYWISHALWDSIAAFMSCGLMISHLSMWHLDQFKGKQLGALAILMAGFVPASLSLTYVMHFFFTDEMVALQWVNTFYFLLGYVGFIITFTLDTVARFTSAKGVKGVSDGFKLVLRTISPQYHLATGVFEIQGGFGFSRGTTEKDPFTWDVLGQPLVYFAVQTIVYYSILIGIESNLHGWLLSVIREAVRKHAGTSGHQHTTVKDDHKDEDVLEEERAVRQGERAGAHVLINDVAKEYPLGIFVPPVVAVSGLSLGIMPGECFGLLGLNGAGKTTVFRVLTGEVAPTRGDAFICGASITSHRAQARLHLGYCPQAAALPGGLTGREVLEMYARLRGVPPRVAKPLVSELLARLGLPPATADKVCGSYSGGQGRKLSLGVALVGAPQVVLLDEPSTGMDPGARHKMWAAIKAGAVELGHTVVLTSHNMEESETLCGRLGIMKGGALACLGSSQHLKNKYSRGYAIELRLEQGGEVEASHLLESICPGANILDVRDGHVSASVPREAIALADLFEQLERVKAQGSILEYSISQMTLEQVFLAVARDTEVQTAPAEV